MKEFILFVYFIIVIFIGISSFRKIKNNKDFFIAGKNAGVLQVSGSLLASILGSSAIIGSVNFAFIKGWAGSWLLLCAALGMTLLYPLINYIKDFKGFNLPEMLGNFYGNNVKQLASLLIPIAWTGIVASQIMGAAKIISILTKFDYTHGVIISGFVFIVYTILGGQLSIIKTDFIQFLFIILGIVTTYIYISPYPITINPLPMINTNFTPMDILVMILSYSTTFIVGPDIYSRLFCAKDDKVMKKSIIITVLVLLPLAYILTRIGIYGQEIFSNTDVASNSILLLIAKTKLPNIVSVTLYFALLSAVISSADTTLLTASSLFTQVFTKDLHNQKSIFFTRILTVIFGIFSILIAIKMKYILSTLLSALAIYSGAFIIPTFAGLFGFRAKEKVVILAILTGGIIALIGKKYGGDIGNYISISAFFINALILYIGKKLTN
ncbi:MAG: sodium:solute symporter family protein [Fusobacterium sp. JB019]|nr:sodium:solute symporter family protein [Fusobacterium sp. JB020]MDP0507434.1 sodium:solute symporter family protein [Fusobacterium sp. JB019]